MSLKFENNFSLSTLISDINGNLILVKQEQTAFLVVELYPVKSQSSSHIVLLFFL
jgi:hypothetical protein